MLLELDVEDFALIDKLSLEFCQELNIVTGETGAGKSILLDAVSLLLGARAEREMIRTGKDSARVEGVFDITKLPQAKELCSQAGIDVCEGLLILTREISLGGRSRCWVNTRPSTVTFFNELGKKLVDLHGQHAHQSLLYPENHLRLLDNFGGLALEEAKQTYLRLYDEWQSLKRQLARLLEAKENRQKQKNLLEFQLNEICTANLLPDEEAVLEQERERLKNADALYKLSFSAAEILSKDGFETVEILDPLRQVVENLKKLTGFDEEAASFSVEAEDCLYRLEELARDLKSYAENVEFNPSRLDAVEERLYLIENLKRKYACASNKELLEFIANGEKELATLIEDDKKTSTLHSEIQNAAKNLGVAGEKLSLLREETFLKLKKGVERELKSLMMENSKLECRFERKEDPHGIPAFGSNYLAHMGGLENIEFLFSANIGEEPKSLSKIASGGEISRLMLAFKLVLAGSDQIPTLIFDEIDAGIGGRTGQAIAEKLTGIAQFHQVLCVTHLPQIAAMADRHFYIEKKEEKNRTVTRMTQLEEPQKCVEIARMLSGDSSSSTLLHASEMLKKAADFKAQGKS